MIMFCLSFVRIFQANTRHSWTLNPLGISRYPGVKWRPISAMTFSMSFIFHSLHVNQLFSTHLCILWCPQSKEPSPWLRSGHTAFSFMYIVKWNQSNDLLLQDNSASNLQCTSLQRHAQGQRPPSPFSSPLLGLRPQSKSIYLSLSLCLCPCLILVLTYPFIACKCSLLRYSQMQGLKSLLTFLRHHAAKEPKILTYYQTAFNAIETASLMCHVLLLYRVLSKSPFLSLQHLFWTAHQNLLALKLSSTQPTSVSTNSNTSKWVWGIGWVNSAKQAVNFTLILSPPWQNSRLLKIPPIFSSWSVNRNPMSFK